MKDRLWYTDEYIARRKKCFWSKVKKSNSRDGCWEWQAGKDGDGYGIFVLPDWDFAHRVCWFFTRNEIPEKGLCILHRCDNPSCVRPDHLFKGTNQDNMDDKVRKGRQSHFAFRGANHPRAILSESQVLRARKLYSTGIYKMRDLSTRFGVNYETLRSAIMSRNWRHLQ